MNYIKDIIKIANHPDLQEATKIESIGNIIDNNVTDQQYRTGYENGFYAGALCKEEQTNQNQK